MAVELPEITQYEFLRPLVGAWTSKIEAADRARSPWKEMADELRMFYARSAAAMWDAGYTRKFWKGVKPPKFRINFNITAEYVAVMLPNLLWDKPHRQVNPKRMLDLPPEIMGGQESPFYQQYLQEQQQNEVVDTAVSTFMEDWLNYCSEEQPGGGLLNHSLRATLDALITGRGCLWPRPYKMPGSNRTLVGSFHEAPERLYIDPDFRTIDDAKWIALRHESTTWELERRFGHPEGSLKGRASLESSWSYGETVGGSNEVGRAAGQTNDVIVWYEIWSKTGIGGRLTGMQESIKKGLEKAAGDYVYLCISKAVPYPLNLPTEQLRNGMSEEEVVQRLQWPVQLHADGRWPVVCLDFYQNTDSNDASAAWPIPPLAPAMGEIKFLNFIIPWLANRVWSSSRDYWAVAGAHYEELVRHLQEGEDQTVIPVPPIVDDVKKAVQNFRLPDTTADWWKLIDLVMQLFRYRTGLSEYAYGQNVGGTQSRTAEDALAKREAVGARPSQMQKQVVAMHGKVAAIEAFNTRFFVTGQDVEPRYGQVGRMLWEQYIMSTDVELVVRQMQYSIEASSIRRPNRERDLANFMQAMQHWQAALLQYSGQTMDYTPINGLIAKWGELHDMDMSELMIPEQNQMMQMQQQQAQQQAEMEQQKFQLEMAKAQADLQGKGIDLQGKQLDLQGKGADVVGKVIDAQAGAAQAEASVEQAELDGLAKILDLRSKLLLGENGRAA